MRALLTNRELVNLGGSELVTVELAEELVRRGWDVTVYSPRVGGGALDTSHLDVTTERPSPADFDLLWIHHNLLIHDLGFRKHAHQRIVFNHMSSYVPLEWPKLPAYEQSIADVILANSEETRRVLPLTGVRLLRNPAPKCFDSPHLGGEGVLLVSNHPPSELTSIVGRRYGQVRVTPDMIRQYDCIICNGKTVQYALRSGVPVYLYDHFGGPGWLTPENFDKAEEHNFSGRPWPRKTADEIRAELSVVPAPMPCPDRFKLEYALEGIL